MYEEICLFIRVVAIGCFVECFIDKWYLVTDYEKPLVMAQIPESTQRFLIDLNNRLLTGINDHFIIHQIDSLTDDMWNNKGDYGHQVNMTK